MLTQTSGSVSCKASVCARRMTPTLGHRCVAVGALIAATVGLTPRSAPAQQSAPTSQAVGKALSDRGRSLVAGVGQADRLVDKAHLTLTSWADERRQAPLRSGIPERRSGSSDDYAQCVETIKHSESLAGPLWVSLKVVSVTAEGDGSVIVRGCLYTRRDPISKYRTSTELDTLRTAKEGVDDLRKSDRWESAEDAESRRRAVDDATRNLARTTKELNETAEKRKEYCERVDVIVRAPPALADSLDRAKLSKATGAGLLIVATEVAVRPPLVEVDRPAAIYEIGGELIAVDDAFLRK